MPDSPTPEPEPDFVCDWELLIVPPCAGEPFYKEHEGKRYCVLHFPGKEKRKEFNQALKRKLDNKDFNFRGVWFPEEISFSGLEFGAGADFGRSTFSAKADFRAATFSANANFGATTFSANADFSSVAFRADALFLGTTFGGEAAFFFATFSALAFFREVTFSAEAYFVLATFRAEADFINATFSKKAKFSQATFADYVNFAGNERRVAFSASSSLDLQLARIDKPDRVSFHTLTLRPHWFVNVDAHEFDFAKIGAGAFTKRSKNCKAAVFRHHIGYWQLPVGILR